jgi:hypothetical protein
MTTGRPGGEDVSGADFEPMWSDVHYAHLRGLWVGMSWKEGAAVGYVVEIGDDYFALQVGGFPGHERRFHFADVTNVSFEVGPERQARA